MLIGKVVGSVVATQKDEKLEDRKLLVVQVHDHQNAPQAQYVVAVDAVGAGQGDLILYATGSSARQTVLTDGRPYDAVVMAVIDSAPEALWAIISKCSAYKRTMVRTIDSKDLSRKGNKVRCRVTVDLPFPLSDITATTDAVHTVKPGESLPY